MTDLNWHEMYVCHLCSKTKQECECQKYYGPLPEDENDYFTLFQAKVQMLVAQQRPLLYASNVPPVPYKLYDAVNGKLVHSSKAAQFYKTTDNVQCAYVEEISLPKYFLPHFSSISISELKNVQVWTTNTPTIFKLVMRNKKSKDIYFVYISYVTSLRCKETKLELTQISLTEITDNLAIARLITNERKLRKQTRRKKNLHVRQKRKKIWRQARKKSARGSRSVSWRLSKRSR